MFTTACHPLQVSEFEDLIKLIHSCNTCHPLEVSRFDYVIKPMHVKGDKNRNPSFYISPCFFLFTFLPIFLWHNYVPSWSCYALRKADDIAPDKNLSKTVCNSSLCRNETIIGQRCLATRRFTTLLRGRKPRTCYKYYGLVRLLDGGHFFSNKTFVILWHVFNYIHVLVKWGI